MNHGADTGLEDELRTTFAAATQHLPPTRDPWARTTRAIDRSRARRRVTAVAMVVVAAAVGVLAVVTPAARRDPEPAGPVVTDPDIRTWPTRGNLADRADLSAALVSRVQAGGGPRVLSVPFLGTVDDLTAALVLADPGDDGEPGDRLQVILLYGRPSVPVDHWVTQSGMVGLTDQRVLTATFTDLEERTHGIAVTLSEGVRLAWSPRPFVDAQGRTVRSYVPLALADGVGTWSSRWRAGLTTVRAEWPFVRVVLSPTIQGTEDGGPAEGPPAEEAAACSGEQYSSMADSGLLNALREAGVRRTEVTRVRRMWCGRVGGQPAVLTGVTTSVGTDFQVLSERVGDGTEQVHTETVRPVPAGRGLDYPWALELSVDQGDLPDGGIAERAVFTVIAPGNATAELQQGDPPFTFAQRRLTNDGFGRVELTESDTYRWRERAPAPVLVTRDVRGVVLHRVPVFVDDPWGTELDGPDAATDVAPPAP